MSLAFALLISFIFFLVIVQLVLLSFILLSFENPIYSIFLLVLVFFGASFLLMELNLFFLSLMILIVYLGALIVLFLFVVMMLNIKALELNRLINFFPSVFIFFFSMLLILLNNEFIFFDQNFYMPYFILFSFFNAWENIYFHFSSFLNIGFFLYSFGSSLLILISLILLISMFGAIVLTLNVPREVNKQNSLYQINQYNTIDFYRNILSDSNKLKSQGF